MRVKQVSMLGLALPANDNPAASSWDERLSAAYRALHIHHTLHFDTPQAQFERLNSIALELTTLGIQHEQETVRKNAVLNSAYQLFLKISGEVHV